MFPLRQTTFYVVRSGSAVFIQNSKFDQIHLSLEASVAHHNRYLYQISTSNAENY